VKVLRKEIEVERRMQRKKRVYWETKGKNIVQKVCFFNRGTIVI